MLFTFSWLFKLQTVYFHSARKISRVQPTGGHPLLSHHLLFFAFEELKYNLYTITCKHLTVHLSALELGGCQREKDVECSHHPRKFFHVLFQSIVTTEVPTVMTSIRMCLSCSWSICEASYAMDFSRSGLLHSTECLRDLSRPRHALFFPCPCHIRCVSKWQCVWFFTHFLGDIENKCGFREGCSQSGLWDLEGPRGVSLQNHPISGRPLASGWQDW